MESDRYLQVLLLPGPGVRMPRCGPTRIQSGTTAAAPFPVWRSGSEYARQPLPCPAGAVVVVVVDVPAPGAVVVVVVRGTGVVDWITELPGGMAAGPTGWAAR